MSEMQKSFVRTCGYILVGAVVVAISIAGIAYEWTWVAIAWTIACCAFFAYGFAVLVGELIYRWRVWGVIGKHEEDMYHTWKYAIFDGRINCTLSKMEFGEYDDDFSDEEELKTNYNFLLKIREVPVPKILQIGG